MSIEKLVKDLKNGGGLTRAKAAAALGKLGDKGAIKPLIEALQDNNAGVRNNAAFALGGSLRQKNLSRIFRSSSMTRRSGRERAQQRRLG